LNERGRTRGCRAVLMSISIILVLLATIPIANAQTRVGAITLNPGEDYLRSAVIDTAHGYAYFGTWTSPGKVVEVKLSTFTRGPALTLNPGEDGLTSAVIDTVNGYAYFGTATFPGKVVEVKLSTFTRGPALTLNPGENVLDSAVIDTVNGYAYFGTATYPGKVVKVNLSTFTRVGSLTLNPAEYILNSAVIDTVNGFAYFGTATSPGKVVKVDLSTFTRAGALTLNPGEDLLNSAVIDTVNGFAYFGTNTQPGKVVKVNLSTFTRVGSLTLPFGEDNLHSAVIDTVNGFAYFGTWTSPGEVVKVDLSTFTRAGALTLNPGEDILTSAVIDTVNGFAYFGTNTVPGIVVKVGVLMGLVDTSWPMCRHNLRRTGYNPASTAPDTTPSKIWEWLPPEGAGLRVAEPVIADGRVYVGAGRSAGLDAYSDYSIAGYVYAIDENTGSTIWGFTTKYWATVGAVANGKVFVRTGLVRAVPNDPAGEVYALAESTGAKIWGYEVDAVISDILVAEGKVFAGSFDGYLYILNEVDGSLIKRVELGSYPQFAIDEGKIFAGTGWWGSPHGYLYSLDLNGNILWTIDVGYVVAADGLIVATDGKVFATWNGYLRAIDQNTKAQLWNFYTGPGYIAPAVAYGSVFVNDGIDSIHCLDENTGVEKWSRKVFVGTSVADGKVLVSGRDTLYALDATAGNIKWQYTLPGTWSSSTAVADGKVFLSLATNNKLYAFGPAALEFDFSLSSSGGISASQGSSGWNTITVTLTSGETQSVILSASGLPEGATASFTPSSGNPTFTSNCTISTSSSTPTGSYTVTVYGTGGELTRTTTFTLTVNPVSQYVLHVHSSPVTGVWIYHTGPGGGNDPTNFDIGPYGAGQTPYGFEVILWAPPTHAGGYTFSHWVLDGSNMGSNQVLTVTVDASHPDRTAIAVYWGAGFGGIATAVFSGPDTVGFMMTGNIYDDSAMLGLYAHRAPPKFLFLKTDAAYVNPTTGVPTWSGYMHLVTVAGRNANPTTAYYEDNCLAPLKWAGTATNAIIVDATGAVKLNVPLSSITASDDYFVMEAITDGQHKVIILWGIGAMGTYVSGIYFDGIGPTMSSTHTQGWYIIHWQDLNGNGVADYTGFNTGEFTIAASGT